MGNISAQHSKISWQLPVSDEEAHARACGRRKYNARRQFAAWQRQIEILRLFREGHHNLTGHGTKAALARHFGVHRSTIGRDFRTMFRAARDWDRRGNILRTLEEAGGVHPIQQRYVAQWLGVPLGEVRNAIAWSRRQAGSGDSVHHSPARASQPPDTVQKSLASGVVAIWPDDRPEAWVFKKR